MDRISREEAFMEVAHTMAKRSTCPRGQTGAVIVMDKRIVSTGYNGAPPGVPHCEDVGCEILPVQHVERTPDIPSEPGQPQSRITIEQGCKRSVHAELNAISFAARHGASIDGAHMFCLSSPCIACSQAIISSGITRVYYENEYRIQDGKKLMADAGVEIINVARLV